MCVKNFDVAIFSDTGNMLSVKLCLMVVLMERYPFIIPSVTLIAFQGHNNVKQFQLKILRSYLIKLKLCMIVDYIKEIMNMPL